MTKTALRPAALIALVLAVAASDAALARDPTSIRIGYAISKTGPNAQGAGTTLLPNYQLWVDEINGAGGLYLSKLGKRLPIEVIEYDDASSLEGAVKGVERLIKEDRADLILAPWSTRLNFAVAPLLRRAGYPHMTATSTAPDAPPGQMAKTWPSSFWFVGPKNAGAETIVALLVKLHAEGKIGNTVAVLNVADKFGIESSNVGRQALRKAAFDIVLDRVYPLGTSELGPIMQEVAQAKPDVLLTFSYPDDTMAAVEEARRLGVNPQVFYTQVGTAYPGFRARFGADAEGMMGMGGWNPDLPAARDYLRRHVAATGQEPDRWASPLTYVTLEMLRQAVERVGEIDRAAIVKELQSGTFDTLIGKVKLEDNMLPDGWYVGQWQNGEFYGIAPADKPGVRAPLVPKPAWSGGAPM